MFAHLVAMLRSLGHKYTGSNMVINGRWQTGDQLLWAINTIKNNPRQLARTKQSSRRHSRIVKMLNLAVTQDLGFESQIHHLVKTTQASDWPWPNRCRNQNVGCTQEPNRRAMYRHNRLIGGAVRVSASKPMPIILALFVLIAPIERGVIRALNLSCVYHVSLVSEARASRGAFFCVRKVPADFSRSAWRFGAAPCSACALMPIDTEMV